MRTPNRWLTLAAVCVATFMLLIDITVVNVALPEIQADLDASFTDLQWVVDAYAVALAATLLAAGSLADRIGRKRVFTGGLVFFVIASVLCGLATTPDLLNLARGLQGIGGAAMFATSLALLAQAFQGPERGTALGIWGATIGAAVAVGPLVGGALTESLGWEWIFFVNVPIGAVAVALTLRHVGVSRDERATGIDWLGVTTFSGALFALVFALVRGNAEGWGSGTIVGLLLLSAVLLVAFVIAETRSADPMFDLGLLRRRAFAGVSIAAFALSASMFAMFLYLTLYVQYQLGYDPLDAGLIFLPITLMSFCVAPVSGKLSSRVSLGVLCGVGLALVGVGLLLMRLVEPDSGWTVLLPGFLVAGAGIGLTNPAVASGAVGVVEPQRAGMASGINSTFRQVGIATGIAALGALFQHDVGGGDEAVFRASRPEFVGALDEILLVAGIVALAGAALSLALIRKRDFAATPGH
jgi:EmrB/QacA subfamily drug resistance transporter